jgi:hypothetical protein
MKNKKDDDNSQLYKFEHWEWNEKKNAVTHHVSWEVAESAEELEKRDPETYALDPENLFKVEVRLASDDESDAYMDGFGEGAIMAAAQARMEAYNGVAFSLTKMEEGEDGTLDIESNKMFTCGTCDRQFDFLDAAMTGDYFVSTTRDATALWHVCMECA